MATKKTIRHRPAGGRTHLKKALWQAIMRAHDVLFDPDETTEVYLKAINAMSQAAANYYRAAGAHELEERLKAFQEKEIDPLAKYAEHTN